MTLLRRRAPRRSCRLHGDNGCEIQREAGQRQRAQDVRRWRADINDELPRRDPTCPDHDGLCRFVPNWDGGKSCMYGCGRWLPW